MAMRRPTMRLKSADLPTFGRPTMAIKPGMGASYDGTGVEANRESSRLNSRANADLRRTNQSVSRASGRCPRFVRQIADENEDSLRRRHSTEFLEGATEEGFDIAV